jgi:hypothetical protein
LDTKKRFSEEQIVNFLRTAERVIALKDLCWRYSFPKAAGHERQLRVNSSH